MIKVIVMIGKEGQQEVRKKKGLILDLYGKKRELRGRNKSQLRITNNELTG